MPTHTGNHLKTNRPTPDFPAPRVRAGRWVAGCGALLLAGVSVFCADQGLADLLALDAATKQSDLQNRTTRTVGAVEPREVKAVGDALLHAQRADPLNPNTAEQLGSHYALNVRSAETVDADRSHWAKAREHYANAVVLRPTSPYSWANLAWTKFHLRQVDAEFYGALESAMRLGPWEPEVQFVIVDLGFAVWADLPVEMRSKVLAIAQNGQVRYATQIAAIAKQRGRLADVCGFAKLATMPMCKKIAG